MQAIEKINPEIVQELVSITTDQAVTIYMPMQMSPIQGNQNFTRLKNLIHIASSKLENHTFITELHNFVTNEEHNLELWQQQTPALLICARPGRIRLLEVPIDTEEYVAVDTSFHLAPILALAAEQQEFYVLMLSQHEPRLFLGDSYRLSPVAIALPKNLEQGLQLDEAGKRGTTQNSTAGMHGTNGFNGRGGTRDHHDTDRLQFFRMIDHILYEHIERHTPLIIASTDSEAAEYRSISKLPSILAATITGNQTAAKLEDIHARAMTIIEAEITQPKRYSAIEEYLRLEGANPERVLHDQKSMIQAAAQGRVDKLLTGLIRYTTDTIRGGTLAVAKITFPDSETSRVLNNIALTVWQASGTVINLLPKDMPHGAPMVARLRY